MFVGFGQRENGLATPREMKTGKHGQHTETGRIILSVPGKSKLAWHMDWHIAKWLVSHSDINWAPIMRTLSLDTLDRQCLNVFMSLSCSFDKFGCQMAETSEMGNGKATFQTQSLEPPVRFELTACGLRNRCSSTELRRLKASL